MGEPFPALLDNRVEGALPDCSAPSSWSDGAPGYFFFLPCILGLELLVP